MATAVDALTLHDVEGICDVCGELCDSTTQELNALSCTFAQCQANVYHQDCLEKFLKSIKCEKNRKTGFQCPRGRGRIPGETCPGRIDKSHPIHPRNDANKKRKKVKVVEAAPAPSRFGPGAKEARKKEREEKEKALAAAAKQEAAQKAAAAKAAATSQKPPAPVTDLAKQRAAAKAMRKEIQGITAPLSPTSSTHAKSTYHAPVRELKTLDEYEAMKAAPTPASAQPVATLTVNAWAAKNDKSLAEKNGSILNCSQTFPAMPGQAAGKAKPAPAAERSRRDAAPPATPPSLPAGGSKSGCLSSDERAPSAQSAQSVCWPPFSQSLFNQPATPAGDRPSQLQQQQQPRGESDSFLPALSSFSSNSGLPPSRPQASPIHTSVCASSLSSQHSASSLQSSLMQADGTGVNAVPPGLGADAPEGDLKLTKAQKKNFKRAEKKARQGAGGGEGAALEGPPQVIALTQGAPEAGPSQSPLLQACLAALARFKMLCCLHDLINMGFADWLCVAAIQRTGTDMTAACEWLMDHSTLQEPLDLQDYAGPAMLVDVSAEMAALEEALQLLAVSPWAVHQAVVECHGNLYEALCKVLKHTSLMLDDGVPPQQQEIAHARRAARPGDEIPEAALMRAAAIAQD